MSARNGLRAPVFSASFHHAFIWLLASKPIARNLVARTIRQHREACLDALLPANVNNVRIDMRLQPIVMRDRL